MVDDCRCQRPSAFRLKRLLKYLFTLGGLCVAPVVLPAASPQDDASGPQLGAFQCPEELSSNEAKQSALQGFTRAYAGRFPNNNVRDMMLFRYRLLVAHSCVQTLKSMLAAISPLSEMLRIEDGDFGPRTEEFNPKTKVLTIWFRKNGEPPGLSDEDLILNFYGWKPPTSPDVIASSFISPRESLHILAKFTAPDDITREPAYFIVSKTFYRGKTYGYINVSKITSVGSGAYTVTFDNRIAGTSAANIEESGRAWLISARGKAIFQAVGHVGVDPQWEQHFAQVHK
jgi:hypothetical protein